MSDQRMIHVSAGTSVASGFVKFICWCSLGGFALVLILCLTLRWDSNRRQRERYPDWVKLTGRADISFEEFRRLDNAGYLKGARK